MKFPSSPMALGQCTAENVTLNEDRQDASRLLKLILLRLKVSFFLLKFSRLFELRVQSLRL